MTSAEPYFLTPVWELSIDKISRVKHYLCEELTRRAIMRGLRAEELRVRQLFPNDLGLTTWFTGPETTWVDTSIRHTLFVGIYKVVLLDDNPTVNSIEFGYGCQSDVYSLDELYSVLPIIKAIREQDGQWVIDTFGDLQKVRMEAYFTSLYIFDPLARLRITLGFSKPTDEGNKLMLGGFVCEPIR